MSKISNKAWNTALFFQLEEIGLKIKNLTEQDEYYTSEFCEKIIDKKNRLQDEGMLNSFIAIAIIYEDLQKEDSIIELNGVELS
jgi:hypothetical protein